MRRSLIPTCSGYVIKEPGVRMADSLDFNAPGKGISLVKTLSDIAFDTIDGQLQFDSATISEKALKKVIEDGPDVVHFSRCKMHLYDGLCKVLTDMTVVATNGRSTRSSPSSAQRSGSRARRPPGR
eukprot:gnl/Chilomastix_cuspidata/4385.p2 GENE.gnl/Chilomastix_cuspidata/4385~~gnl/Chilomastix_cuspidata/4385.p2  ORF type:complete len:126 (-),score=12.13 gnl/Chilomastix_cuspidata/4385:177-554(-)